MASNSLPQNPGLLIQLGGKMENGITSVGASVPVTMVTAQQMHDDTVAFQTVDNNFNAGRSTEQQASRAYQATIAPLYNWVLSVSNVLASRFGTRWNTQWAHAGFINHTTAIPQNTAARITLASRVVDYFKKHPSAEVPSMGLTAAAGAALVTATQSTQTALATADAAQAKVGDAWTAAYEQLISTMTALLKNLEGKLSKEDSRWLAFGLQIPANITTPSQPTNVTAHMDGNGALVVQCDPVATAWRYRFRMMILGVQTDYALVASSTEPIASITGKADPGQTVQIIVQAVSGNLQGKASDPIVFTVPFAAKAAMAEATGPTEHALAPSASDNRHTNGHRLPAMS